MEDCLSKDQISRYADGQLSSSEKLQLNKHLSRCTRCRNLLFSSPGVVRAATMVLGRLEKAKQPCPSKRTLMQYVDGELPEQYCDRVADHARACPSCNGIIVQLTRLREDRLAPSSLGGRMGPGEAILDCTMDLAPELYALLVQMTGRDHTLFRIDRPCTKLGRAKSGQACIVVDDPTVSDVHCKISVEANGGEVTITVDDLESRNGTWVNGKWTSHAVLKDRDMIRVGQTEFLFRQI